MSQTIFSLLIAKKIPSYQIFEDEHNYAFLAKDAINLGHIH